MAAILTPPLLSTDKKPAKVDVKEEDEEDDDDEDDDCAEHNLPAENIVPRDLA